MSYSFADVPTTIKESEAPKVCPICGSPTKKYLYSVECAGDWHNCQWGVDFEEEQNKRPRYDHVHGIIIED